MKIINKINRIESKINLHFTREALRILYNETFSCWALGYYKSDDGGIIFDILCLTCIALFALMISILLTGEII